jgi:hypothetical protein
MHHKDYKSTVLARELTCHGWELGGSANGTLKVQKMTRAGFVAQAALLRLVMFDATKLPTNYGNCTRIDVP